MVSDKTMFDPFFMADEIQLIDSDNNPLVRPFVYCSDIIGFVSELAQLRGFSVSDLSLKVGVDGGKGRLKMILTMYEPDRVLDDRIARNRGTREAGIGSGEHYTDLQIFYDMVGINAFSVKFSCSVFFTRSKR